MSFTHPIHRACPVCAAVESQAFLQKAGLKLVRCSACAMVYVPALERAFADGSFYETEAAPFYLSEEKLRGDFSPSRYLREIRLLRRHVRSGAVLDVGCSTGGFLHHLHRSFPGDYEVFGADVPGEATKFAAAKGVNILAGDFLSFKTGRKFDAITFWAVLEHVADPGAFLRQAHRLLQPGGSCFFLVPNIRSLAVKILGARYRYILPQHLNYFSRDTLQRLASAAGFELAFGTTTHFNPVVIWQDRKNLAGLVSDADRARLLGKTNALKKNRALAPLRLAYASAEKILGAFGLADNVAIVVKPCNSEPAQPEPKDEPRPPSG